MKILKMLLLTVFLISPVAKAEMGTTWSANDFVAHWYSLFDHNAPVEEFLKYLADDGLDMKFPEAHIRSHNDFRIWYAGIQKRIRSASHEVRSINYYYVGNIRRVSLDVVWRATEYSGKKLYLHTQQEWDVTQVNYNYYINRYYVRVIDDHAENSAYQIFTVANGSSQQCICHGGPGNYPYACAPIQKTCFGGPGNYPYNCSVCPQ